MEWYLYSESETSDGSDVKTYRTPQSDDIEVTIRIDKKLVKKKIGETSDFNVLMEIIPRYIVNDGENSKDYSTKEEAFAYAESILNKSSE